MANPSVIAPTTIRLRPFAISGKCTNWCLWRRGAAFGARARGWGGAEVVATASALPSARSSACCNPGTQHHDREPCRNDNRRPKCDGPFDLCETGLRRAPVPGAWVDCIGVDPYRKEPWNAPLSLIRSQLRRGKRVDRETPHRESVFDEVATLVLRVKPSSRHTTDRVDEQLSTSELRRATVSKSVEKEHRPVPAGPHKPSPEYQRDRGKPNSDPDSLATVCHIR